MIKADHRICFPEYRKRRNDLELYGKMEIERAQSKGAGRLVIGALFLKRIYCLAGTVAATMIKML